MKLYLYNLLFLLPDCALNTLFCGSPFETCSSRLGRHYETSDAARTVADIVDGAAFYLFGQMNHCKSNIQLASHYEGREGLR